MPPYDADMRQLPTPPLLCYARYMAISELQLLDPLSRTPFVDSAELEFEDRSHGEPPAANGKKRNQKNAPRFDVQSRLYRMTRVDLTRIDGVDAYTALKVVSEVGTDMTKWESAKHFASWLGLSLNNRQRQ